MPGRQRSRTRPTVYANAVLNRYSPYSETTVLGSYVTSSGSETMLDWVTDNYRNRVKAGDIINNNMSYSKRSLTGGSGSAVYISHDGVNSYSIDGCVTAFRLSQAGIPDILGPDQKVFDNLIADARSACLANINSATVATGEDIKEANKTINLLKNPIQGISTNLNRVAKDWKSSSKKDRAKSLGKFLSDYWVQYRFAFTPLVKSMENILIEANKTVPPRYSEIERVHGRKDYNFKNSRTFDAAGSLFNQDIDVHIKVHAYTSYKLSGASNFGNGRRWGSRLRDWPDRTWQVMPYSFMVDRVYNVGNVINGIVNMIDPNVSIISSGNTYRITTVRSTTYVGDTNPNYTVSAAGETIVQNDFTYDREMWEPDIRDVFPIPNVGGLVSNATKVLDLTALIGQRLLKR